MSYEEIQAFEDYLDKGSLLLGIGKFYGKKYKRQTKPGKPGQNAWYKQLKQEYEYGGLNELRRIFE